VHGLLHVSLHLVWCHDSFHLHLPAIQRRPLSLSRNGWHGFKQAMFAFGGALATKFPLIFSSFLINGMNHWFVYMIIASDYTSAYFPLHQHFPVSPKNCERHSSNMLCNPSTVSKLLLRETRKYIPQPACMKRIMSEWRTYAVICESCHICSSMTKQLWYRSPWMRRVCPIIPIMNGVCIHYVVTNDNSDSLTENCSELYWRNVCRCWNGTVFWA